MTTKLSIEEMEERIDRLERKLMRFRQSARRLKKGMGLLFISLGSGMVGAGFEIGLPYLNIPELSGRLVII